MVAYASPAGQTDVTCALCGLSARRRIVDTFDGQTFTFCCYACRYIYQLVAPEVAAGTPLPVAIGQCGLDLDAPCCRGIIHGDPADVAASTLSRLMLNSFLAMMVMVLSLALYSDLFFADWGAVGQGTRSMLQAIAMLFATPAVLLLALPILEEAVFTWQARRQITTSALIAVGSLAAYGLSVYATFTGQGHTYFETATMILLLVTLGRWLDAKAQVESRQALEALLARAPTEVSKLTEFDAESRTPVEQIMVGDRLRVRPGENFAVDGEIISGIGSVNEASITGEANPAHKRTGDLVYAGTTNLDGSFVIRTTQVGEGMVMGKLVRLLDEARLHRSPIERLADRIAARFVPAVFGLTAAAFLYWTWQAGPTRGIMIALSILLIACPCALGIATPLAVWAALGRAAQAGILIRDSATLEKLARIGHIFFDKTGTLTTGQPTLAEIVVEPAGEEAKLLAYAASLEYHADHPLGRAVLGAAEQAGWALLPVDDFQVLPGLGICGRIEHEMVYLGSRRLIENQGLSLIASLQAVRDRLEVDGSTVVYLSVADRVQAIFGLTETIRPDVEQVLAAVRAENRIIEILTGDSQTAGDALGRRLGVTVHSQLLPHDKLRLIELAERTGSVAMIGDGLNDAPALARAGIGIALGCGADVTREAADVSLLGDDLTQIAWLLALARRTYQTIGWNLAWAFIYNVIGIGLALAGILHPILAAIAMVVSSAMVIGNSLRLFKTKLTL